MVAPKKHKVIKYMRNMLNSGKFPPGSTFVSESVLISRFGFCKNTVRAAFTTLVKEGLLERRRGQGTFVMSNLIRENLHKVVHLLVADPMQRKTSDPFIENLIGQVHWRVQAEGWEVKLHLLEDYSAAQYKLHMLMGRSSIVHGHSVILAGFDYPKTMTDTLRKAGIQVFTIGRPEDEKNVIFVHGDNEEMIYLATKKLTDFGHKRIALVHRRETNSLCADERCRGFIRAMDEKGLIPDMRLVIHTACRETEKIGNEIWQKFKAPGVNATAAIICGDDATAEFVAHARREGVRIPDDLSIIACAPRPVTSGGLHLTRVSSCDDFPLGDITADCVLRAYNGERPESLVVPAELYEGNTIATSTY